MDKFLKRHKLKIMLNQEETDNLMTPMFVCFFNLICIKKSSFTKNSGPTQLHWRIVQHKRKRNNTNSLQTLLKTEKERALRRTCLVVRTKQTAAL